MLDFIILQSMSGGSLSELVGGYKNVAGGLIAVGFAFAGIAVVKKVISQHEKMKEAIIQYIVALVVFLLIWSMV